MQRPVALRDPVQGGSELPARVRARRGFPPTLQRVSLDVVAKSLILSHQPGVFLLQGHNPVQRSRRRLTVRFCRGGGQVTAAERERARAARIRRRVTRRDFTTESLNLEKRVAQPLLRVHEIVFERSLGPPAPGSLLAQPRNLGVKPAPRAKARDGRLQGLDADAAVLLRRANLGLEPRPLVTPPELRARQSLNRVARGVLRVTDPLSHRRRRGGIFKPPLTVANLARQQILELRDPVVGVPQLPDQLADARAELLLYGGTLTLSAGRRVLVLPFARFPLRRGGRLHLRELLAREERLGLGRPGLFVGVFDGAPGLVGEVAAGGALVVDKP